MSVNWTHPTFCFPSLPWSCFAISCLRSYVLRHPFEGCRNKQYFSYVNYKTLPSSVWRFVVVVASNRLSIFYLLLFLLPTIVKKDGVGCYWNRSTLAQVPRRIERPSSTHVHCKYDTRWVTSIGRSWCCEVSCEAHCKCLSEDVFISQFPSSLFSSVSSTSNFYSHNNFLPFFRTVTTLSRLEPTWDVMPWATATTKTVSTIPLVNIVG